MRAAAALIAAAAMTGCSAGERADDGVLRVMSLDGCADQYVLALVPDAELAVSPRADDPDSYMREAARGRRRVRTTLEAAVGFRPDVVVRQWGGDARMVEALRRRGVKVVEIGDASTLAEVRAETVRLASALGRPGRGRALVADLDANLARAAGAGGGAPALYLTAAGWTAGSGTLVDAVMSEAGLRNVETAPGYRAVGLEALALNPPERFVLAFFDRAGSDRHGAGRHPVVRAAAARAETTTLPSALLTCPGWFTAEAAARLAG